MASDVRTVEPMKRNRSAVASIAAVVAAAGLVASCSSGSSDSASGTTTVAPSLTTIAPAAPASTTAAPTTVASTSSAPTTVAPTTVPVVDDTKAIAATRALFAGVTADSPGCSVAIGRNGKVVFAEAYGAAGFNPTVAMTTSDVVDIGSTSKQFTATALQLLVSDGKASWSDPVSKFFPSFGPWAATVTLGQMTHHISGIPDYIGLLGAEGFDLADPSDAADALASLAKVTKLDFAPGSSWAYSNSNYFLMGQVVEQIAGEPLGTFVERELFAPSGMKAVMDYATPIAAEVPSFGRNADGKNWDVVVGGWVQLGDGGIRTTPSELITWSSQYWDPTVGGADINTLRFADASALPKNDLFEGMYGLGIFEQNIDGIGRMVGHSGGWENYVTLFEVVPDKKLSVAVNCLNGESQVVSDPESGAKLVKAWL
jgi:CubicO group peptidase (beta-lactamase class C family)